MSAVLDFALEKRLLYERFKAVSFFGNLKCKTMLRNRFTLEKKMAGGKNEDLTRRNAEGIRQPIKTEEYIIS